MATLNIRVTQKEYDEILRAADDAGMTLDDWCAAAVIESQPARCRECGCTEDDCSQCVEKTGAPCWWVEPDLCSACADSKPATLTKLKRRPQRRKKP